MGAGKFLAALMLVVALDCNADLTATDNSETAAKAAIRDVALALQTELKQAMQAGGPVTAIGVCNTRAMPIAAEVASGHDMALSRVSLRNRNPDNAPNAWQKKVLEDFEAQKQAGKDVSSLGWSETVSSGDGQEFRFMKAIPTTGICLKCHGSEIAPEVSNMLAELYPGDRATGFDVGDIRGAFVAVRKLPD